MKQTLVQVILEGDTKKFVDFVESSGAPPIYKLSPQEARAVLEKVQAQPVKKSELRTEDKVLPVGPSGKVSIRIFRPASATQKLPTIFYIHGAGWVMGSTLTHESLVNALVTGTQSAVVFVNYSLSPEAKFPVAIEESYAALKYVAEHGNEFNLDTSTLCVAGDSVGGNMSIAMTLLAKERHGPKIHGQVLFYPVTNHELTTESYELFSDGPWLTKPAMEWFWNAYQPDAAARSNPLISPLKAPIDQLRGLPPALVMTAEFDVLRDEGEKYAHHLMQAGVRVVATRFLGTIHDFAMLNALARTPAAEAAFELASQFINHIFKRK